ncbi:MAG: fused MFS/spermidine synthase, partial [Verrucomicrobiae bacterium]|nr:fused MFS/spermidine synthase [Verrucomicrobiae bacterium]
YIEMAIGVYALLFCGLYALADRVFVSVGAALLEQTALLLLLKAALSVGLLLGPTILMGGTLPMIAAWLQKSSVEAGRRSALFYAINSLGAVCGAWLAGFILVPRIGMPPTIKLAAFANLLIGLAAIAIARTQQLGEIASAGPSAREVSSTGEVSARAVRLFRWGCILVALTGGISMSLEVLASRCLALIFGSSLQAFSIMLMSFILGIGLGSVVIASPRRQWPKETATVLLVLTAAAWIGLLVFNIENLVELYRYARSGLSRSEMGYFYHQVLISAVSIVVLGLPAAALGAVLPLWIRVVSETSVLLGERVGRLLTWNTLGAVTGATLAGFFLMPTFGLRGSFLALALVLGCAGILIAVVTRRRLAASAGVIVTGLLVLVAATGGEDWRYVLSSGIFRLPNEAFSPEALRERRKSVRILFYEDAPDATVSVESIPLPDGREDLVLRINGKPDASAIGDRPTELLLGQLPLLVKPDSKDVFCFGVGSGITAGTALGYPIERLVLADNCEPVLRAARLFDPWNRGVLTNSRTRIYHEDARTVLKLRKEKYDVIMAAPSNPWMAGIGSVFSREFYELVASRLKPGGIMAQWFQVYEMDDATVQLVLRTFASVFPAMEVWDVAGGDIIMLGSLTPWQTGPEVYRRAFEFEWVRSDLASIGLTSPDVILTRQLASQRTAFAIAGPGRYQRDNYPVLEYVAPRALYVYHAQRALGLQRFDERTLQMDLAPLQKNRVLSEIDVPTLARIFVGNAQSVNPSLQAYIEMLAQGHIGPQQFPLLAMPCVFRGTNDPVFFIPDAARTNEVLRALFAAEAVLKTNPTNQLEAVQSIHRLLVELKNYSARAAGWSAAYYAAAGAKAALRGGSHELARGILLRGLELEPDSIELHYLARIMMREGVLRPTELPANLVRAIVPQPSS